MKFFIILLLELLILSSSLECQSGEKPIHAIRVYTKNPNEESFNIYEGSTIEQGTKIFEMDGSGIPSDNEEAVTIEGDLCIKPNTEYLLHMADSVEDAWSESSYVRLTYNDMLLIESRIAYNIDAGDEKTLPFSLNIPLDFGSSWYYSTSPETTSTWILADVSYWQSFNTGSYPKVSSITRYYRKNIENLPDDLYLYSISTKSNCGFIIYFNGNEVFRYNVPETGVTSDTPSTSTYEPALRHGITHKSVYVRTDKILRIAIEVHATEELLGTEDPFDFAIIGAIGDLGLHLNTDIKCYTALGRGGKCNALKDGDYTSNASFKEMPVIVELEIKTENKEKDWFNAYELAAQTGSSYPTEWSLYGSDNNGTTWIQLDYQLNYPFTEESYGTTFPLPTNVREFNKVQLVITKNSGNSANTFFYEILLKKVSVAVSSSYFNYNNELISYAVGDPISEVPESQGAYNFTIEPELPDYLTFDKNTGSIGGYFKESTPYQLYTITSSTVEKSQIIALFTTDMTPPQCAAEGIWESTMGGLIITLPCSEGQEGEITRTCTSEGQWEDAVDTCKLYCPEDGEWPKTESNSNASLGCSGGREGSYSRYCLSTGYWDNSIDTCAYYCPKEENWKKTKQDTVASIVCPFGYASDATRQCDSLGNWNEPIGNPCEAYLPCYGLYYLFEGKCELCSNGILTKNAQGVNIDCTHCSDDEYVVNNICTSKKSCGATIINNISFDSTYANHFGMPKCTSDQSFGYYAQECQDSDNNMDSIWSNVIEHEMCYTKPEVMDGQVQQEMNLNIQNLNPFEDPFMMCYVTSRTLIKMFHYTLSNLLVTSNLKESTSNNPVSNLDVYFASNIVNYDEFIESLVSDNNKHSFLRMLKTERLYFPENIQAITTVQSPLIQNAPACAATSETGIEIPLYSYSPSKCEDRSVRGYWIYQCQQVLFRSVLVPIQYITCPQTYPYILYKITINDISVSQLHNENYIGLYRAILSYHNQIISSIHVLYYENEYTEESTNTNIYFSIQTPSDIYEVSTVLSTFDTEQKQKFMNQLESQYQWFVTDISITTTVKTSDSTSDSTRRLRG
ncbi:hypothetical protein WA158_008014 [Blastocystis sp. Blastoise]